MNRNCEITYSFFGRETSSLTGFQPFGDWMAFITWDDVQANLAKAFSLALLLEKSARFDTKLELKVISAMLHTFFAKLRLSF